jgi:hypothetical protein
MGKRETSPIDKSMECKPKIEVTMAKAKEEGM